MCQIFLVRVTWEGGGESMMIEGGFNFHIYEAIRRKTHLKRE